MPMANDQQYRTRVELDLEGKQRAVIDAKDRIVMKYDYDLLGHRIHQASMEAGDRIINLSTTNHSHIQPQRLPQEIAFLGGGICAITFTSITWLRRLYNFSIAQAFFPLCRKSFAQFPQLSGLLLS
ncbi:hypothetical protein [Gloeocapsopsis dulcis]|nr:hypothetical protein [Gloeocapsopsis dulcis]WNN89975.1 hypothetical protein P0S91_02420 [Gloeocapsopsis dulcis]